MAHPPTPTAPRSPGLSMPQGVAQPHLAFNARTFNERIFNARAFNARALNQRASTSNDSTRGRRSTRNSRASIQRASIQRAFNARGARRAGIAGGIGPLPTPHDLIPSSTPLSGPSFWPPARTTWRSFFLATHPAVSRGQSAVANLAKAGSAGFADDLIDGKSGLRRACLEPWTNLPHTPPLVTRSFGIYQIHRRTPRAPRRPPPRIVPARWLLQGRLRSTTVDYGANPHSMLRSAHPKERSFPDARGRPSVLC